MPGQPKNDDNPVSDPIELGFKNILALIIELRFKELERGNQQFDLDNLDPLTVDLVDKIINRMLKQEGVGFFCILNAIKEGYSIEQIKRLCEANILFLNETTNKEPKEGFKTGINYKLVLDAMRNVNKVMREARP